jgi:hypothetical protein
MASVRRGWQKLQTLEVTVRNPWILRLAGFVVGSSTMSSRVTRARCRINIMRLPPAGRALGTGQPVRRVTLPVRSWARVLLWRLEGKL